MILFAANVHSIIFVFIGTIAIICSALLLVGLRVGLSTGNLIWFIFCQGISLVHQISFSIGIIIIMHRNLQKTYLILIVAAFLTFYVIVHVYLIRLMLSLCQQTTQTELTNARPNLKLRFGPVADLLGNMRGIGQTTPP